MFIERIEDLEELRNRKGTPNVMIELLGEDDPGDEGSGLFYWDSLSTNPDNGTTIIAVENVTTGRWRRITSGGSGSETDPIYTSQKGQPNGAATLDSNGKLTATQFPNVLDTPSVDMNLNVSTNTLSAAVIGYNPTAWNEAYNGSITSVGFNVSTGDLTLTKRDGSNISTNLDFRYILQEQVGEFIQDQNALAQDADYWILGDGRINGDFRADGTTRLQELIVATTATVGSQVVIGTAGALSASASSVDLTASSGNSINLGAGGRIGDLVIDGSTGVADFNLDPTVNNDPIWYYGNFPLNITTPSNNQILRFNGTEWVNVTPSYITSLAHVHNVANDTGVNQFSVGVSEAIRFAGSGDTSISFNSGTKTVTITSIPGSGGGGAVTSFNGRTGGVVSIEGDYSLELLGDTTITTPANGQILQYNGTEWVNTTPSFLTGNQTITLTGNVTGSGTTSIVTTIANNSVTYARMQDMTASRLLGRYTGSTGDPQEISLGSGLALNSTTGVLSATGSGGTVTSVGLGMPSIFSVSGSPVTTTGTLTASLVNQSANTFFGGPTAGGAAVPTFRTLVAADIPSLDASKTTTGVFNTARLGGGTADTTTFLRGDGTWASVPGGNVGTVTSVGLALPSIFSVSGSPITSTGTLTGTLVNQNANLVFAGPSTGSATVPTFRSLVTNDFPNSGVSAGTYNSLTVNAKGIVTAATNVVSSDVPTSRTLTITPGAGITVTPSTAQDLSANRSWTIASTGVTTFNGASGAVVYNPTLQTVTDNGRTTSNWLQITNANNVASTGSGLELSAGGSPFGGNISGYNRVASVFLPLRLNGGTTSTGHNLVVSDTLTYDSFTVWNSNNHPTGVAQTATFAGATVPATLNFNSSGHFTSLTTRSLLPGDIGAVPVGRAITLVAGAGISVSAGAQNLSADRTWTITNTGAPASGSGNYIQNTTTQQSSSNFNISGNGIVAGSIGIGITPTQKLHVSGNGLFTGTVTATGGGFNSLRSLKNEIKEFSQSALDIINKLDVKKFKYNNNPEDQFIGLIAEETPKELLMNKGTAINIYNMLGVLAKGIQELNQKLNGVVTTFS